MFIAFPIILLSLVALGVQAVRLSVPGTVTIGQSAQVQWDLDGGRFGSLDINLVTPAVGSRKLTTIRPDSKQQSGEASVPFPDDLAPGEYHLEADSFSFNVGSSAIFSLVSPPPPPPPTTTSTTVTSQSTPTSTTVQSQSQTPSPTSTSSHSLSNQSSSKTDTRPSPSQAIANNTLSGTDGTSIITNSSSTLGTEDQTTAIAGQTTSAAAESPSDTSTPNLSGNTEQSSKPTSIIVGAVVGGIALIFLLIFLAIIFARRRNRIKRTTFYRDRMVRSPGNTPLNSDEDSYTGSDEIRTQAYD